MKNILLLLLVCVQLLSCQQTKSTKNEAPVANQDLANFFEKFHEESLALDPLSATFEGDNRFNDQLPIDFTDSYRATMKSFYQKNLDALKNFKREELNDDDKLSYDIFKYTLDNNLEGLQYPNNYIPFHQFYGLHLTMGTLGSGESAQPFKTVKDYENWAQRIKLFSVWADSSIVYFRKGVAANYVLPKSLVVKVIPQLTAMVTDAAHVKDNLFYSPVKKFPEGITPDEQKRLTADYTKLVNEHVVPTFKKLADFMKKEYLPKARATSGISALPNGTAYYEYLARLQTTTTKTPDEIYNTGLAEVKRIRGLMDSVKNAVGFTGDLAAFFDYMKNDKKFMPYKTADDVLAAFNKIYETIQPNLKKMFTLVPKTKFEIRQTEAFRAASASAEYQQGTPDGSRPGIFYVPILEATKFNTTSGMESLFLHEAIPGHHYQISLQQENTALPKFRRFGGQNAYVEGWALYCESLGKELGVYTDPYQYVGALGDEIHRAIRLVVDVGIHTKNMTREEAIKYMMENEAISEQGATAEIERYMAIPGQALGYKIGALKIRELRTQYEKKLGNKFKIADFHNQVLKDGSVPLDLLEKKLERWATAL